MWPCASRSQWSPTTHEHTLVLTMELRIEPDQARRKVFLVLCRAVQQMVPMPPPTDKHTKVSRSAGHLVLGNLTSVPLATAQMWGLVHSAGRCWLSLEPTHPRIAKPNRQARVSNTAFISVFIKTDFIPNCVCICVCDMRM